MLLACPDCHSTFRMTPDMLREGRTVRCTICRYEWFAEQSDLQAEPEKPPQPNPLAPAASAFDLAEQFGSGPMPLGDEAYPIAPTPSIEIAPTDFTPAFEETVTEEAAVDSDILDVDELPQEEPVPEAPIDFESFNKLLEKTERQQAAYLPQATRGAANWFAGIMLFLAVLFTGTCWALVLRDSLVGTPVIGDALKSAGVTNTSNLAFADLTLMKTKLGSKKTRYAIKGAVINKGKEPRELPTVRIRLVNKQGDTIQQWDFAQGGFLKPGEEKKFNAMKLESATLKDDYAFVLDLGNPFDLSLR